MKCLKSISKELKFLKTIFSPVYLRIKETFHFPSYPFPCQYIYIYWYIQYIYTSASIHNVATCVYIICTLKTQCASGITHK